jgi:hypothetical protein
MFRFLTLVLIVGALLHYTGYLDYEKIKARISGTNTGMGDFYNKTPSPAPDGKQILDKIKDTFSGSGEPEERKAVVPRSKPVFSEGESNPRRMNIIRDDQKEFICFYPDIPSVCPQEKKLQKK